MAKRGPVPTMPAIPTLWKMQPRNRDLTFEAKLLPTHKNCTNRAEPWPRYWGTLKVAKVVPHPIQHHLSGRIGSTTKARSGEDPGSCCPKLKALDITTVVRETSGSVWEDASIGQTSWKIARYIRIGFLRRISGPRPRGEPRELRDALAISGPHLGCPQPVSSLVSCLPFYASLAPIWDVSSACVLSLRPACFPGSIWC